MDGDTGRVLIDGKSESIRILGLDTEHRMNFPGKCEGYWEWRFEWSQVLPEHAARLAHLCRIYGRDGSNDKRK